MLKVHIKLCGSFWTFLFIMLLKRNPRRCFNAFKEAGAGVRFDELIFFPKSRVLAIIVLMDHSAMEFPLPFSYSVYS